MRAVVVAGSDLSGDLDPSVLSASDLLVAVDSGAETLAELGLVPALLIGDMDSVTPQTRADLERRGTEVIALPRAKDETDLEHALSVVVDRGADQVFVFGALGGPRLDHLLGNIMLLTSPRLSEVEVHLVDDAHDVFLAHGDARIEGDAGDLVGLVPLTGEVEAVRTEGLLYSLQGETLARFSTRGLSNEMLLDECSVRHGTGALLVIHYRGREA